MYMSSYIAPGPCFDWLHLVHNQNVLIKICFFGQKESLYCQIALEILYVCYGEKVLSVKVIVNIAIIMD